jgi:hypothetical protein
LAKPHFGLAVAVTRTRQSDGNRATGEPCIAVLIQRNVKRRLNRQSYTDKAAFNRGSFMWCLDLGSGAAFVALVRTMKEHDLGPVPGARRNHAR